MKILCNKNTTKLVKGAEYEASVLINGQTNVRKYVYLKKYGSYSTSNFRQLDGSPLPEINWRENTTPQENTNIDEKNIKKGDIIVCKYDTKILSSGKKYLVSDVLIEKPQKYSSYHRVRIKVEGYNRWLNCYRFRKCNKQEIRDIGINEVFDQPEEIMKYDKSIRKIDTYSVDKKNKAILSVIFNAMIDPYRNNLSILDWAINKSGKRYDITKDDLLPFLDKNLLEIIKIIDK